MAKHKTEGHYCKVCGQRKSNESFSGKGHASHACKVCARLSASARAEAMTLTRLHTLPDRRLTDEEKKWLENRTRDKRSAVKELACEIYRQRFPHTGHKALKKQRSIEHAEFTVCAFIWDNFCDDERLANIKYTVNRSDALLCMQDLDEQDNKTAVLLRPSDMALLLKWMVDEAGVFLWEESLCGGTAADEGTLPKMGSSPGKCEPEPQLKASWSLLLLYDDGTKQYMGNRCTELPEQVSELYYELSQWFSDDDDEDNDFDFYELVEECQDLMALSLLVSSLLIQAEEYQDDSILGEIMMDVMMPNNTFQQPTSDQPTYHIYSDAQANYQYMQSFLTQAMAGEEQLVLTGKERLARFTMHVSEMFTAPKGALISAAEIEAVQGVIEEKYGLLRLLSESGPIQILRIPCSHKKFNSICNAIQRRDNAERIRYELYLFHVNGEAVGHPAYILLHEIGHALQTHITRNIMQIPQSFRDVSKGILGVPVPEDGVALELYADAFAMAMMQTFGWQEYDPFKEIPTLVKEVFRKYFDMQLMRIADGKKL